MTERVSVPGRRLGRIPTPIAQRDRIPKLARYIELPTPPAGAVDVSNGVTSWPMFLNDRLGDCACAAPAHMDEIFSKEAGQPKVLTDQDVLALYELQGYNPADPATDRGSSMGNVLDDWKSGRWAASQILAYATVNVSDQNMVKTALWLFSGLYIGIELPITAQSQQVWDVVPGLPQQNQPGSWGGHAVDVVALDDTGLTVITWGAPKRMTWAFWHEYVDECYAVVSKDFDALQGKPVEECGFDEQQLLADMAELDQY